MKPALAQQLKLQLQCTKIDMILDVIYLKTVKE